MEMVVLKKRSVYLMLFWEFFKFGCFTFGGGMSIVSQMQNVFVNKKKLLTEEELLDITSVARSLPGAMVANSAMMFGYRTGGVAGGIICTFAMTLMPLVILGTVTFFYTEFRDSEWIISAMNGIRAAVVPIIISAAVGMVRGAFKYLPCIGVCVLSFALFVIFDLSCIYLVIIGALFGLVICEANERRGDRGK